MTEEFFNDLKTYYTNATIKRFEQRNNRLVLVVIRENEMMEKEIHISVAGPVLTG